MAFAGDARSRSSTRIGNDNAKGEFYLTDAVAIARGMELSGGRDRRPRRTRCAASTPRPSSRRPKPCCSSACARPRMDAGVTLVAPETVFLAADTEVRPRRGGRAVRGVRPRRDGRGRRGDPRVLASRGRACRQGRAGRPVRAAAAGRAARRQGAASAISSRSRRR